jgi:lysozyme family protein
MAPEQRKDYAANYIVKYTAPLVSRMPDKLQPFVQDLAFNRGMGGATIYLQQALNNLGQNVSVDGGMGPKTLQAINSVNPTELMREASKAQLLDEKRRAEQNPERRKFLNGLENRITNRFGAFGSV